MNLPPKYRNLIGTAQAAKLTALSQESIVRQCNNGDFRTAVRPGGPGGHWRIDREEVIQRITPKR